MEPGKGISGENLTAVIMPVFSMCGSVLMEIASSVCLQIKLLYYGKQPPGNILNTFPATVPM